MRGHTAHRVASSLLTLLSACGGGSGGSHRVARPRRRSPRCRRSQVSQPTTFRRRLQRRCQVGTLYTGTALEPSLVVNPTNSSNLIAEWQQDRWSTGGSQALSLAASFDGGTTWTLSNAAVLASAPGAAAAMPATIARASNGWLTVRPERRRRMRCRCPSPAPRSRRAPPAASWWRARPMAASPGAQPRRADTRTARTSSTTRARSPPTRPTRTTCMPCGTGISGNSGPSYFRDDRRRRQRPGRPRGQHLRPRALRNADHR